MSIATAGEFIPMAQLEPTPARTGPRLIAPVDQQECWGAGCTYRVGEKDLRR